MCSSTVTRNQKRNSNYFLKGNSGCFVGCRGGGEGVGKWCWFKKERNSSRKGIQSKPVTLLIMSSGAPVSGICLLLTHFKLLFLTMPRPNPIFSSFSKFKHPTNFYTLTGALWLNKFEKSSKNSQKIIQQGNPSNWVIFLIKWNLG